MKRHRVSSCPLGPSDPLSLSKTKEEGRHHLDESLVQKAVSRMRNKSASGVLASLRGSPYAESTRRLFARCGLAAHPAGYSDADQARELIATYYATIEFFRSLLEAPWRRLGSRSGPHATRSGIPSRHICSKAAMTFEPSRSCWAIATSKQR